MLHYFAKKYLGIEVTTKAGRHVLNFIVVALYYVIACMYYMPVEHWSVLDTCYWVTVSITTVGYGDLAPTNRPVTQPPAAAASTGVTARKAPPIGVTTLNAPTAARKARKASTSTMPKATSIGAARTAAVPVLGPPAARVLGRGELTVQCECGATPASSGESHGNESPIRVVAALVARDGSSGSFVFDKDVHESDDL